MSDEWLKNLKHGDEVIVIRDYGYTRRIERVSHTTKTQIEVDGLRYQRKSGRQIGAASSFSSAHILEPTSKLRAEVSEELQRQKLKTLAEWIASKTAKLRLSTVQSLIAVIIEVKDSQEPTP